LKKSWITTPHWKNVTNFNGHVLEVSENTVRVLFPGYYTCKGGKVPTHSGHSFNFNMIDNLVLICSGLMESPLAKAMNE
jgi:hypothetical protein